MQKLKYGLMAILCPLQMLAQQPLPLRALQIGDKVPGLSFAPAFNASHQPIKLAGLSGRLVILDFWGRYCAPCIKALPVLDSLQRVFKGKIKIITISDLTRKEDVQATIKRFIGAARFQLPVLLNNRVLNQLFPHLLVSHVVWIDGQGRVAAITNGEYVTKENIETILAGKKADWPVKEDLIGFDYTSPLLKLAEPGMQQPRSLYYSTFTSFLAGIAPPFGTFTDSAAQCSYTAFYNQTLPGLCQMALDYRTGASRNEFVLQVKDTSRYFKPASAYYTSWEHKNSYCYYLRLPAGLEQAEIERIVKQDLLHWLAIMGIQATKETRQEEGREVSKYLITEK